MKHEPVTFYNLYIYLNINIAHCNAISGKEFEEDKLIGPTDLFTHDGYRSADHDSMYHIQLLVVEGSFSQADIGIKTQFMLS